jgi:hypothetical protein
VLQVQEDLDPILDDLLRPAALHVDDEPHAARVMLVRRIVKTGRARGAEGS